MSGAVIRDLDRMSFMSRVAALIPFTTSGTFVHQVGHIRSSHRAHSFTTFSTFITFITFASAALQFPDPDISESGCIAMVLQPHLFFLTMFHIHG